MEYRVFVSLAAYCAATLLFFTGAAHGQALAEAGLPATSRDWSGADYQRIATILSSGKIPLPTVETDEGGAFLARMGNSENLATVRNPKLPLSARVSEYQKIAVASSQIYTQYLTAASKGAELHTELTFQLCFLLHVAEAGVIVSDAIQPTIPRDEHYEARMAGDKQMRAGVTGIFSVAEAVLGKTKFYPPKELNLLLMVMAGTLPTVKKAFAADYKVELRKKLEARKAAFPDTEDAAYLQKMIVEIGS